MRSGTDRSQASFHNYPANVRALLWERVSSNTSLCFTIQSGPNAGLTLSGWRLQVRKEDTYIIAKTVGGIWKTSLHGDVAWRHAMTREHVDSGAPPQLTGDRAAWRFTPTEYVNGQRLAFVVATARSCFRPETLDTREAQIPVEDRWDRLYLAKVWMTEAGSDKDLSTHPDLLGDPFTMSSGRRVWLTFDVEETTAVPAEPIADSVILLPQWPEKRSVFAPGLLAVGARWR